MPNSNAWLTPDTIPAEKVCRVLRIPAEYEYIVPAVMGALFPLTQAENWELFGAITPTQMAAAMITMYFDIQNTDCEPAVTFPIGTTISNPSPTPDAGWLLCDGTQYNRADYPALAALIPEGTPNIGGDSTVFFVPNLTGRVLMGAGSTAVSPATGAAMGILGGSPTVGLGINDIPAHTHGYATGAASGAVGSAPVYSTSVFLEPQIQTASAGNGSAPTHANMQPYFALYVWIYAGA